MKGDGFFPAGGSKNRREVHSLSQLLILLAGQQWNARKWDLWVFKIDNPEPPNFKLQVKETSRSHRKKGNTDPQWKMEMNERMQGKWVPRKTLTFFLTSSLLPGNILYMRFFSTQKGFAISGSNLACQCSFVVNIPK